MKKYYSTFSFIAFTAIIILVFLFYSPMPISPESYNENLHEVKAEVVEVDNSEIMGSSIAFIGYQVLEVEVLEGEFKGEILRASNGLTGQMEVDNIYKPGDKIVAAILVKDDAVHGVKALDYYRQDWQLILFIVFVISLVLYAGVIGLKALFSFIASLFIIWYVLIPGLLKGQNPLYLTLWILILLTGVIMYSVAGFSKKAFCTFSGTVIGLGATVFVTMFFGAKTYMDGMTAPFIASLLFSGHMDLNVVYIFYASIIIGASGAAMDIAMDISSSMEEIKIKKPDISSKELIQSGFNIGRDVIGTMTTTLLLAYSGGYLTLLMLFMTQNSSFIRIVNLKIVSAEIVRTLIGSLGLVIVAPITTIIAGWIYSTDIKFLKE